MNYVKNNFDRKELGEKLIRLKIYTKKSKFDLKCIRPKVNPAKN